MIYLCCLVPTTTACFQCLWSVADEGAYYRNNALRHIEFCKYYTSQVLYAISIVCLHVDIGSMRPRRHVAGPAAPVYIRRSNPRARAGALYIYTNER